ncbi:MAG: TatD family hydrolase [Alphaproteobacteria bacterium]|nr:TatD family hydrolase [Alphaproteobacteria bacterium]
MLVDSHCHLDYSEFKDLPEVIANAKAAGVDYILSVATQLSEVPQIAECIEKFPGIFGSVGVHPEYTDVHELPTIHALLNILRTPGFVAIGEVGLDMSYADAPPLSVQEEFFRVHIEAAREAEVPVIVHTREAEDETMAILEDEFKKGSFKGLIHCFTGTEKLVDFAIEHGFYISVSGIITFGKKAEDLRNVVKKIPLERLLVETDAPFLAPTPMRGKRNEPAFTKYTAEKLAEIKGITFDKIAKITTDNFFTLFSKAER